jgi:hypothetical protein
MQDTVLNAVTKIKVCSYALWLCVGLWGSWIAGHEILMSQFLPFTRDSSGVDLGR